MQNSLEKLLAQRQEIERALLSEHSQSATVMFTDIVGSTAYFEQKGDIAGMALLKRHNGALFPVVEAHQGRVVKTIGDAIMAVFAEPANGLACAAAMQRTLQKLRRESPDEQPIHIRIGLHGGTVLVDGGDVFGDTVNTAARVAHEAGKDEILISGGLVAAVPKGLGTSSRGALPFKGKAEPVPVSQLLWDASAPAAAPAAEKSELFVLELGRSATGLRVSALDGAADKGTVKPYEDQPLLEAALDALTGRFGAFASGQSDTYVGPLREAGRELFDRALPLRVQEKLAQTPHKHLRLQLDDGLVQVPWELMHDGQTYLGLKFAMGRLVTTAAQTAPPLPRRERLTRVLVVSDPAGNLPAAQREGDAVAALWRGAPGCEVIHLSGRVTRAELVAKLSGCDALHLACHAHPGDAGQPAGLVMVDGLLSPDALIAGFGAQAPHLVVANTCHAGGDRGWSQNGLHSLAEALLLRGVLHFLGPVWTIPDEDALAFALRFYEQSLSGTSLGGAVLHARHALLAPPSQPLSFAAYVLYGDPREGLAVGARPSQVAVRSSSGELPAMKRAPAAPVQAPAPSAAAAQPTSQPAPDWRPPAPARKNTGAIVAAFLCLGVMVAIPLSVTLSTTKSRNVPPVPTAAPVPPAAPKTVHTGPLRVTVMPFKNATGDASLDTLKDALQEMVLTSLGGQTDIQLLERGQLDLDVKELELGQGQLFDPSTRAQLGKLEGVEVAVLGAYLKSGEQVRVTARLVNVETGAVVGAVTADKPQSQLFDLQDAVATGLKAQLGRAREALR
jgi:class 3 adenylate cyclase/TolB-like protein